MYQSSLGGQGGSMAMQDDLVDLDSFLDSYLAQLQQTGGGPGGAQPVGGGVGNGGGGAAGGGLGGRQQSMGGGGGVSLAAGLPPMEFQNLQGLGMGFGTGAMGGAGAGFGMGGLGNSSNNNNMGLGSNNLGMNNLGMGMGFGLDQGGMGLGNNALGMGLNGLGANNTLGMQGLGQFGGGMLGGSNNLGLQGLGGQPNTQQLQQQQAYGGLGGGAAGLPNLGRPPVQTSIGFPGMQGIGSNNAASAGGLPAGGTAATAAAAAVTAAKAAAAGAAAGGAAAGTGQKNSRPRGRSTSRSAAPRKDKGEGAAAAALAAAAAAAEESSGGEGDGGGSSGDSALSDGEKQMRKKREVGGDEAERRHQALQEKNRRAQRRFRERQKSKLSELHKQIEDLTGKVSGLQTENAALHSRTSILEKVLDMRNEQIQVMQETKEEPGYPGGEEQLATLQTAGGQLVTMTPEMIKELSSDQIYKIYQSYVKELSVRLVDLNRTQGPEADGGPELDRLVKDLSMMIMRLGVVKPLETRKFIVVSRQYLGNTEAEVIELWKSVMRALELSLEQKREVVELKRMFLSKIEPIMDERKHLNVQIQSNLPHDTFHTKNALTYIKAHEAVIKLRDNLRAEQHVVLEFAVAVFRGVFRPKQMATLLVKCYPAVPDALGIASALAAELGHPESAQSAQLTIAMGGYTIGQGAGQQLALHPGSGYPGYLATDGSGGSGLDGGGASSGVRQGSLSSSGAGSLNSAQPQQQQQQWAAGSDVAGQPGGISHPPNDPNATPTAVPLAIMEASGMAMLREMRSRSAANS